MKKLIPILILLFALNSSAVPLKVFAISCYYDPQYVETHVGVFIEGLIPGEQYVLERRYMPGPWHEVSGHTFTAGFGFDYEARWLVDDPITAMYRIKKVNP